MQAISKQQVAGFNIFGQIEVILGAASLLITALLLLIEAIFRKFQISLGISQAVMYLVIWITFLGGMLTSKEKKHIGISTGIDLIKEPIKGWIQLVTYGLSIFVSLTLAFASLSYILFSFSWEDKVFFIPLQLILMIMPLGFAVMGLRFVSSIKQGIRRWATVLISLLMALVFSWSVLIASFEIIISPLSEPMIPFLASLSEGLYQVNEFLMPLTSSLAFPLFLLLIVSAFLGTPIFVVLGGAAILLYTWDGSQLQAIPDEAYIVLKGGIIPAIPLFALVGFILSESKAGERLVTLFKSLFGWVPGGLTIMSVLLCAAFTALTGGSGVTILALGALLSYILENNRYKKSFSQGLITTSASTGLLLPPSIPMIMYGIVAQMDIKQLFLGSALPGLLIITLLSAVGIIYSIKTKVATVPFSSREARHALKISVWEILLPVLIIAGYFSGITTLVETASLATIYIFCVEVFINKDLKIEGIIRVFQKCLPVIGGVLVILITAKGLSSYLVIAEIPNHLVEWANNTIHSKYVFLILINFVLLITGCLMDVYSAILVVAPLVIPLAQSFGINEVHMAIIFIANLEIGYLTPPVGINLLLASYRFNEPLSTLAKSVLPFLLTLFISLLIITYVPLFFYGH